MVLPPRGDPRRPLHLAVWTARGLAAVFLFFGACGLVPQLYLLAQGGGQYASVAALGIVGSMFYLLPGVAYVVFAIYLRQHRFWAVVAALVLAGGQGLMFLLGTGVLTWVYFREGLAWAVLIPIALMGVVLFALAVLIYLLARSFAAIRHPPFGREERGFEPLRVRPVISVGADALVVPAAADIPAPGPTVGPGPAAETRG